MRRITRQMSTGKPVVYFEDGKWRCTWFVDRDGVTADPDIEEDLDTLWHRAYSYCQQMNAKPFAQDLAYDFRIRHKNAVTALRVAGL